MNSSYIVALHFYIILFAVYFDVSKNDTKLTDTKREMIKKYLAYVLEHYSRKHPGERIVALMDMSAASLGNVVRNSYEIINNINR